MYDHVFRYIYFVDHSLKFFKAGHETTSTTVAWCLYHLSQNPEIEKKVHEEIDRILGDKKITQESLKELAYVSAVLDETLRMHPVGALILREASQDCEYKGYVIPKGYAIGCNIITLHHDPRFVSCLFC